MDRSVRWSVDPIRWTGPRTGGQCFRVTRIGVLFSISEELSTSKRPQFHHNINEIQSPRMAKDEKQVLAVKALIESWNNPFLGFKTSTASQQQKKLLQICHTTYFTPVRFENKNSSNSRRKDFTAPLARRSFTSL